MPLSTSPLVIGGLQLSAEHVGIDQTSVSARRDETALRRLHVHGPGQPVVIAVLEDGLAHDKARGMRTLQAALMASTSLLRFPVATSALITTL